MGLSVIIVAYRQRARGAVLVDAEQGEAGLSLVSFAGIDVDQSVGFDQ